MLPVRTLRLPRGQGYSLEILPPVAGLNTSPPPDLSQAVNFVNQAIEALVLSQPGQYLWGYARYKTPRRETAKTTAATTTTPNTSVASADDNGQPEQNKK
jgi:KDO2-lipid IV(A) lauroyltransferase